MKKSITFLLGIILLISFPSSMAFTIGTNISIEPTASNTRYNFSTNYTLTRLEVQSTTPYFNGSIFQIEADSETANVTINSLNSMSFTVTATDTVTFILGGFTADTIYEVKVDNISWASQTANANGIIQFTYDSWSTHTFEITSDVSSSDEGEGFRGGGFRITGENEIMFYVYDFGGQPVVNAEIKICEYDNIIEVGYTDLDGLYEASLDDGEYIIYLHASGYVDAVENIVVTRDDVFTFIVNKDYFLFIMAIIGVAVAMIILLYLFYTKKNR